MNEKKTVSWKEQEREREKERERGVDAVVQDTTVRSIHLTATSSAFIK